MMFNTDKIQLIQKLLVKSPGIGRSDIGKATKWANSTVNRYVIELMSQGFILSVGDFNAKLYWGEIPDFKKVYKGPIPPFNLVPIGNIRPFSVFGH